MQNEGSEHATRNPRLCGFARVTCPAGSEIEVQIDVDRAKLMVVNQDGERIHDGKPVFYVGVSQPEARSLTLTGHSCVKIAL